MGNKTHLVQLLDAVFGKSIFAAVDSFNFVSLTALILVPRLCSSFAFVFVLVLCVLRHSLAQLGMQ